MDQELARIQALFDTALEHEPAARSAFLDSACGADSVLRLRVERLLAAEAAEENADAIGTAVRRAVLDVGEPAGAGRTIGAYRLLDEIGRGGMGIVWLAERADESYKTRVAVKLVRGGFADRELQRRFRAERQILADLRHPNIARLLDGGETGDGTPYLVMEYVDGIAITRYAEEHALDLDARLKLFQRVCDAVQHAHRSLVVHRDIKPSNVLVGSDASPRLMDFGIAKPLAGDEATETTLLGQRLTPSYASPEQLRGARITVATDVYSLGVLLYELLTGSHPFTAGDVTTEEVRRRVLEDDAALPSEALRRTRGTLHGIRPRDLAGDLDNIVMKALRKEPEQRYASVEQMTGDIQRHVRGEPVSARAASLRYRAGKFLRRNVAAVVTAMIVLALVAGFAAFHTARLTRERDLASRERRTAEQVSTFLVEMFRAADPTRTLGDSITARQILAAARARLDTALKSEPAVRARLLHTMGSVYQALDALPEARNMLDEALRLTDSTAGPTSPNAGDILNDQVMLAQAGGDFAKGVEFSRRLVTIRELQGDSVPLGRALTLLGGMHLQQRNLVAADSSLPRALLIYERASQTTEAQLASTMHTVGLLRYRQARYDEALSLIGRSMSIRQRVLPPRAEPLLSTMEVLALVLREVGQKDSARVLYERVLADREVVYGKDSRLVAQSLSALASLLLDMGQHTPAIAALDRTLQIRRRLFGETHATIANTYLTLGSAYAVKGDYRQAVSYYDRSIAIYGKTRPPDHVDLSYPLDGAAHALNKLHRSRDALPYVRRALAIREKALGASHPLTAQTQGVLGTALLQLGQLDDARAVLQRSIATLDSVLGPTHDATVAPVEAMARVLLGLKEYGDAAALFARGLSSAEARQSADAALLSLYLRDYARALRGSGRVAEAQAIEGRAVAVHSPAPR